VGQDEIDIVKLADVSVVVLVPGMGDDVQALKAGIMEIADIFVINKCDRAGVEKMERAVTAMLSLAHRQDGWIPPIIKTIATEGTGVDELLAEIDKCYDFFDSGTLRIQKKREAARQRLLSLLEERLVKSVLEHAFPDGDLTRTVEDIADRKTDPYTVVDRIIKAVRFW
jgi:LAO/AO transport system kinase